MDTTEPKISIDSGLSLIEGNRDTTNFVFAVSLDESSDRTIAVNYAVKDNSAILGEDYLATDGTLEFEPGETEKTISVAVFGDRKIEGDESFTVRLSNAVNASISGDLVVATILNDDDDRETTDKIEITKIPVGLNFDISDNKIVWTAYGGLDAEIFLDDGSEQIQITDNDFEDVEPQILGNRIVWSSGTYLSRGIYSDIYLYQDNEVTRLTDDNLLESNPQISESLVVWHSDDDGYYNDEIDGEIYVYDGNDVIQLTDNDIDDSNPQVSGNNIVWTGRAWEGAARDDDGYDEEIYFYDGNEILRLTDNEIDDSNPQISGNRIVWDSFQSNQEIYLYDGENTIQLTDNNISDREPQISGDWIVWTGYDGNDDEIYFYDGESTTQLTDNNTSDREPQIFDDYIVWMGNDGNDEEIYLHRNNVTFQLTNNNIDDSNPQISGNRIVWYSGNVFEAKLPANFLATDSLSVTSVLPRISIGRIFLDEGNSDNTEFVFTVFLSEASGETITVDYVTEDETAIAGEDYIATSGSLEFSPGELTKEIAVTVIGDNEFETVDAGDVGYLDESFILSLNNPVNAELENIATTGNIQNDDPFVRTIELFRFRNLNFETDTYVFVGEAEKDAILEDENFSRTFSLDGVEEDGTVSAALTASLTPREDLVPIYRLKSLDVAGTFFFISQEEYDAIFADDSEQKDKWEKEGFDSEENDIPEFYLHNVGAGSGLTFNRFQNNQNNTFLYAEATETEAIENDPNRSNIFTNQGVAFESFV